MCLIEYQSCDTELDEDKSTLLEVQIGDSGYESYQWSKDGQALQDGADFSGASNNILFINKANKSSEGTYSCSVTGVRILIEIVMRLI